METKAAISFSTPAQFLPGVGPGRAERLARLGIATARDVLFLFPRSHEFPAPTSSVDQLKENQSASLIGTIGDAELVSRTPGKSVFAAIVENETGAVRILFFNQPFRAEQLVIDRRVLISGVPKLNGLRWEFSHPNVTILDQSEQIQRPQILPTYPLTEGLRQSDLRRLSAVVVDRLADELTEVMPEPLRIRAATYLGANEADSKGKLLPIAAAVRQLHYPDDESSLAAARTRLVFQELLVLQLALAIRRRQLTTDLQSPGLESSAMIDARIVNRLPFELTGDQRRAIEEITGDMARQFPMNRLLQGDVGSGKTVVAVYAMMLAVAGGHQAVLMTPTEVLAQQHFATLSQMLSQSRVRIGLLCGSLTASERSRTLAELRSGDVDLLVGTQALLDKQVEFKRLGLCVIDEQHRFGVRQRVALRSGGIDPHYLVMSATPIPRSLAMTVFGDVDLSTLREKPPGRGTVHTYLAHDGWRDRWWAFVRKQLDEGRQAFVVAPRVSSDERPTTPQDSAAQDSAAQDSAAQDSAVVNPKNREDVSSVASVFRSLAADALKDYRVGLLHGRLSGEEKRSIMSSFAAGEIQVLVSTTVIEVGIDVPNATVMTILGADRFGLAQLHQLRGRVSRGKHAGHVCVFTDGENSPVENERLRIFEHTDDGFELAEADFRLRGPGDLLGHKQSGLPPMRIADLHRDIEILAAARQLAQEMVDVDPELRAAELALLRQQVMRRYGSRLDLGDVA